MRHSLSDYLSEFLTDESSAKIIEIAESFEFLAHKPFVIQGQHTNSLFFLPDSVARYYVDTESGETSNKHFIPAPCIVGSTTALIKQAPCRINIASFETCTGYKIPWPSFRVLMNSSLEIMTLYTTILEQLFIQKEERETSFLTDSAKIRYQKFLAEFALLEKRLPQYHIASYLGITPVSLSRIRRELTKTK